MTIGFPFIIEENPIVQHAESKKIISSSIDKIFITYKVDNEETSLNLKASGPLNTQSHWTAYEVPQFLKSSNS